MPKPRLAASNAICTVSTRSPPSIDNGGSTLIALKPVTPVGRDGRDVDQWRPRQQAGIRCIAELLLQSWAADGISVSTPSNVQFGAGFFVDAKRMAISISLSVRSTRRGEVSIVTRISGNCAAKLFQARQQNLVGKCWCAAERQRPCRFAAGELFGGLGEKAQSVIDQGRIISPAPVSRNPRFSRRKSSTPSQLSSVWMP